MDIQKDITEFLLNNGAGQVGFCRLGSDEFGQNNFGLGYAVSYTMPLSDAVIDEITDRPTHTYFHHYRTVNALIDNNSLKVGRKLQRAGYRYVGVPASQSVPGEFCGVFSHKYAAVRSGLGYVGKSGLFVSTENGPRVRLGTILTDCDCFEVNEKILKSECGECRACVRACPAMAIKGNLWEPGVAREDLVDPRACSEHMKKAYQRIGRGAVCGICMAVCPRGSKKY